MSVIKEIVMRAILDKTDRDPSYEFTIKGLVKITGVTEASARKWINIFLKQGLIVRTDSAPFKGRLRSLDELKIIDFFIIYSNSKV